MRKISDTSKRPTGISACGVPYVRDAKTAKDVMAMAGCGVPQHDIARVQKINLATLRKYYEDELAIGAINASRQVAGSLYRQAMGGNVAACIFWLKARAHWREVQQIDINIAAQILAEDTGHLTAEDAMREALEAIAQRGSSQPDHADTA